MRRRAPKGLQTRQNLQFCVHERAGAPDLYPGARRDEIDAVNEVVYRDVNNGVYRCGFATDQAAYEEAFHILFARLDWLEERLADQRYLVGDTITEADVRLFTTLVRFVSGVPMLERKWADDPEWQAYCARVPVFLPRPIARP